MKLEIKARFVWGCNQCPAIAASDTPSDLMAMVEAHEGCSTGRMIPEGNES